VLAREPAGPGIRVESALYDGVEVTPYYDSLLAKVTAWGRNREGARARMKRALSEFRVVGVATNIPYIQQILDLPDFVSGTVDTGFLDRHQVAAEPWRKRELARSRSPAGNGRQAEAPADLPAAAARAVRAAAVLWHKQAK
jgi:pyruvate carboxylase